MPPPQNGARMDEDLGDPRERVTGGPMGYEHGMRDERQEGKKKHKRTSRPETQDEPRTGQEKAA